ncbi:MAG: response regulator transcription factor [Pseudomonadota bacterium]
MSILVVDDDPGLRQTVRASLERAGLATVAAADGAQALVAVRRDVPDLVVLDIGLPEMDGLEVCRRLRAVSDVPILFLTARDEEIDRVIGLEMGADDYVTKPFSPRELVARVRAILRRGAGSGPKPLSHGGIELDPLGHRCRVAGRDIALSATEMTILACLMRAPGRMLGRATLAAEVWGAGSSVAPKTIDSHLRNLRRKLAAAVGTDPIETIHGVGVRIGDIG